MSTKAAVSELEGEFLTFRVKNQIFGLNILHVREIMEYANVTHVPLVPEFIKGILNLRGNVVPVLEVGRRFGWPAADLTRLSCIIVTELEHDGNKLEIGLLVDAVNEVVKLSQDKLEGSPNFGANIRADFISNVGKVAGKFVLLLNISKLLDVDEIQELRAVAEPQPASVAKHEAEIAV